MADQRRTTLRKVLGVVLGGACGIGVWRGGSIAMNVVEAWDAPAFYFSSLFVIGIIGGALFYRAYSPFYFGTLLGQLLGLLVLWLENGAQDPLLLVGCFQVLLFSIVTLIGAALSAAGVRTARAHVLPNK